METNKEHKNINFNSLDDFEKSARDFEIIDEESYNESKSALIWLKAKEKEILKPLSEAKELAYKPYVEAQKAEKEVINVFAAVKQILVDKNSKFIAQKKAEEEAARRAREEEAARIYEANREKERQAAEAGMTTEEAGIVIEELPEKIDKNSEISTAGLRKVVTYRVEVIDKQEVEDKYKEIIINERKIIDEFKAAKVENAKFEEKGFTIEEIVEWK